MDWNQIEGNWAEDRAKLRAEYGEITDADLDRISVRRERILRWIEECLELDAPNLDNFGHIA